MPWQLDRNLKQDCIKRRSAGVARNLDTLQRIVLNLLSAWRNRKKKAFDKKRGVTELLRWIASNFTNLLKFLLQKLIFEDFNF